MPVLQKGLKEEEVIDGEGLPEFVEEADMPDFVEGLSDVKESRRAVGFAVEGVMDCVNGAGSRIDGKGVIHCSRLWEGDE
jgi:hypothetical protein